MKKFSLILGVFLISLTVNAYGQSLSELDKQLKEQNEQRATEIEASQQLQQGSFTKVDCPQGTHERAVSGGGIVCVDDVTGREVNPEDYWKYQAGGEGSLFAIGIGIVILIVIIAIVKSRRKPNVQEGYDYSQVPRHGWTEIEKEQVRIRQNGKCNKCGRPPPRWEYHHRNGDRSNNSLSNCVGLCPNCHSVMTHDE